MEIRNVKNTNIPINSGAGFIKKSEGQQKDPSDLVSIGNNSNSGAGMIKINVLHMNDVHGAVEPMIDPKISEESPVGGLAYSKAVIDQEKAKNPEGTITLNAGDVAEGSMVAYLSKGQVVTDAFNEMKFDAVALGNHDFAWGQGSLKNMVEGLDAPVVAANVEKTGEGKTMDSVKPYVMMEKKGVKLAIIGLDTPEIEHFIEKSKLKGLQFKGAADTIKRYLPEVKKKGADVTIVLSHLGLEEDKKLAKEVEGIDVIVGGHSHSELTEGHREGNTTIVQAGSLTRFVGNLELEFDPNRKMITAAKPKLIPVINKDLKPDPAVEKAIKPYVDRAEAKGAQIVGEALEELHYAHREAGKLNQIHADSMRAFTGAEIGICNSRTLRGHVPEGTTHYKDLYSALPFTEENCVTMTATGQMLMNEIEDDLRDDATELAVPTGMKYEYDKSKPEGSRITSITVNGKPLDPKKKYKVVMNETMSRKKFFNDVKDKSVRGGAQSIFFDYYAKGGPWVNDPDDRVTQKS